MGLSRDTRATLVVGATAAVALAASMGAAFTVTYPVERELWLLRASGYSALGFLFGALTMSPIARLLALLGRRPPTLRVRAFRRAMGMTSAVLATVHAAVALSTYLSDTLGAVWGRPYLRLGLLALLVLWALWATSFRWVVKRLRMKLWKELHRLAYVAAALVFGHLMMGPFADRLWTVVLFATLGVVGALRWLPERRGDDAEPAASATEGEIGAARGGHH